MKTLTYILLLNMLFLSACQINSKNEKITQLSDYQVFIKPIQLIAHSNQNTEAEVKFWQNKLQSDPQNWVFMTQLAYAHSARFQGQRNVNDLAQAEKLFLTANEKISNQDANLYYALCQNAITRHQFRQARAYLQKAYAINGQEKIGNFLLFDVSMELGNPKIAYSALKKTKNEKSFDHLIRLAKYQDFEGNLDQATQTMERAYELIKNSNKKGLICWSLSNLADMYGHAGKVKQSYETYLKVLKIDKNYDYALKGIAWIAFSHDKNSAEAQRIYTYLFDKTQAPDYYLSLAEVADYEQDTKNKEVYLQKFVAEVSQDQYGDMYNKYLILLFAEEFKNHSKALELAQKEVQNRPTPETYDLLAWVYFQQKNYKKATEIADKYLKDKTFEPEVLFHLGCIYKAAGRKTEAQKLLQEALEAEFELGILTTQKIRQELAGL
jgi:tetratricopeptide (TPR) repeat protein